MALSGAVLGPLIDVSANATNPPALPLSLPNWTLIATALCTHLQSFGVVTPTFVAPPTGGPVTGTGTIGGLDPTALGQALTTAATQGNPAAMPTALPHWMPIAAAIVTQIQTTCTVLPGTLQAPPGSPATAGGPLTGLGTITGLSGTPLGDAMAQAAAAGDATAYAKIRPTYLDMGSQIATHVTSLGQVGPGTMVCPPGGGPIVGSGVVL